MTTYAGRPVFAPYFVDPSGDPEGAVSITVYNRGTVVKPTLYTSRTKATPLANPFTADSLGNAEFYVDPGEYDALVNGVTLPFSSVPDPVEPLDDAAVLAAIPSGTYVRSLGLSNGVDDAATINAALAGGGYVKGVTGETYLLGALLEVESDTTVDMRGCTVEFVPGTTPTQMIRNRAQRTGRAVVDGAITATDQTLTSATAAFALADVGDEVWVWGAGLQGDILRTTIASRTSASVVELAAAAVTTVTGATVSIGDRDRNIAVIGGTWDRGMISGGSPSPDLDGVSMLFRRVDGLVVAGVRGESSNGRYYLSIADATLFVVDDIEFDTESDGVHLTGPCRHGSISNIRGTTFDDMVSLTPTDWPGQDDVHGNIEHIDIADIHTIRTTNTAVKVLGGGAAEGTAARHIRIRNVSGYATNTAENVGGLVWIGDDSGLPVTVGGYLDDIVVENVAGVVPVTVAGSCLVFLNPSNAGAIRIEGVSVDVPDGMTQAGVMVAGNTNIRHLTVADAAVKSASGYGSAFCTAIRLDALSAVVGPIAIGTLTLSNVEMTSGWAVAFLDGGVTISRLLVDNCDMRVGHALIYAIHAGISLPDVAMSNCRVSAQFLADLAGTTHLQLTNVKGALAAGTLNLAAAAVVTVQSANLDIGTAHPIIAAGGVLKWRSPDFPGPRATAGQYATPPYAGTSVAVPGLGNATYAFLPLAGPCHIDRVGVEVTTGLADSTIRLGIFADNDGQPGTLLVDTGPLATTGSGAVEGTVDVWADAPGIWLASVRQSADGATVRVCSAGAQPIYTRDSLVVVTTYPLSCFSKGIAAAAFASNPSGQIGDVNNPIVAVRFAA